MPCPDYGVIEQSLTFTIQAKSSDGVPVNSDALPTYKVYENETGTEIATGTMALLDDANTTGFYSEQLSLTTANGYDRLKTYTIRVESEISSIAVVKPFSFICMGEADVTVASGNALTTTARFKDYAGITSTDDDTLVGLLIARATAAIELFCQRTLVSEDHRDYYNGDGSSDLILRNYPVTKVQLLSGSIQVGFSLTNTSTDAYHAMVTVSETEIRLLVQGGTNADDTSLTLADYSTLTLLFAAITAMDKGWGMLQNTSINVWSPAELLPTVKGSSCLNEYSSVYLPDDPLSEYTVNAKAGIIHLFGRFADSFQGITIRYTAGYSSIPADLEQICIDLVANYYNSRKTNNTLKSEKMGDYSYTNMSPQEISGGSTGGMPSDIAGRLQPWRSHRI